MWINKWIKQDKKNGKEPPPQKKTDEKTKYNKMNEDGDGRKIFKFNLVFAKTI